MRQDIEDKREPSVQEAQRRRSDCKTFFSSSSLPRMCKHEAFMCPFSALLSAVARYWDPLALLPSPLSRRRSRPPVGRYTIVPTLPSEDIHSASLLRSLSFRFLLAHCVYAPLFASLPCVFSSDQLFIRKESLEESRVAREGSLPDLKTARKFCTPNRSCNISEIIFVFLP